MTSTTRKYQKDLEEVILKVQKTREEHRITVPDGTEIYGYPRDGNRVAWGINAPKTGFNMLRGIRCPDGTDKGVM